MAECIVLKGGGGADLDVITAGAGDVLAGKVIVDRDGEPLIGIMPNRGAVSQALNAGGSYMVPVGYHNGSGTVTASSLASQTSATATAAQILSSQTAWVNGNKVTGTMTVNSILSFSAAAYSTTQILLQWQNPYAAGGKPFSGVFINYSTSGYPGTGGTRIYTGYGNNATPGGWSQVIVTMPAVGTTYYFSATAYASGSPTDIWGNTLHAVAATTASGVQTLTESTNFTVPAGVRSIDIFCVGGGGQGGRGSTVSSGYGGGGGGGGYTSAVYGFPVVPGQQLAVNIGAGGYASAATGASGGSTTVLSNGNVVLNASGGGGGTTSSARGGNGGSGGGAGSYTQGSSNYYAGNGGSDGSDGGAGGYVSTHPGTGQHTSTWSFHGVLYSGGGGGGGATEHLGSPAGVGGGGGGGNGGSNVSEGTAGTYATGGGGGGSLKANSNGFGYAGGSGVCIIRW